MKTKQYIGTYYSEEELISKMDELHIQGHREEDFYVIVKEKSDIELVRSQMDAEIAATKPSWMDRIRGNKGRDQEVDLLTLGEDASLDCEALVLVDVAPRLEPRGVRRIIEFMRHHQDGFETLEQVRDAITAYNPRRPPSNDLSGLRKNLRQHSNGRFYWHWDPAFLNHANAPTKAGSMFDRARLELAARQLDVPVLLIRGYYSDVLSDRGATELLTLIPEARYVVLEQAGHMVAGDR
ncbi:general stress protein [Halomonas sp. N3-2A]|uniref:general stress protein n=1 Tax=Halomonas sp. N3-2A TaxID=2014541 RepID=UPI0018DF62E4|nr:general stress protein [Halomonas sp. N3-2A]